MRGDFSKFLETFFLDHNLKTQVLLIQNESLSKSSVPICCLFVHVM